jgi:3-keto-disaccharide hydrolase
VSAVAEGEGGSISPSVTRREGPAFDVPYHPGEWQTCDIRLIGPDVTIVLNGKTEPKPLKGLPL